MVLVRILGIALVVTCLIMISLGIVLVEPRNANLELTQHIWVLVQWILQILIGCREEVLGRGEILNSREEILNSREEVLNGREEILDSREEVLGREEILNSREEVC